VDECTTSSQVMSVTGVGGEPATQAHTQTGVGGEPATHAHTQTGVGGEPATHAHIQTGVVLECSFPRFPRMRLQAASETGLPGFSGGFFFSPKNIPISKNSSNFASFCVADGFKTNLSY